MAGTFQQIYFILQQIPPGRVATYGQVAQLVPGAHARVVSFALASLDEGTDIPWHRIINRQGKISLRSHEGQQLQRQRLEQEGILFDAQDRIDLSQYQWQP